MPSELERKLAREYWQDKAAHAGRRVAIDILQGVNYLAEDKYDGAAANARAADDGLEEFIEAVSALLDEAPIPRKKDDRSARGYSTRAKPRTPKPKRRTAKSRSRVVKTPKPRRR